MKKLIYILSVAVFLNSCGKSELELPNMGFLHKILDGYDVRAIAFDSKGNAWVVTQEHEIIRYNEKETVIYNSKNSELPKEFWFTDIAVDKKDNVWIGTDNGVWKYDGKKFTLYNSRNTKMPEDIVWSIAVDSKNNIWMASCRVRQGGLVKYDGTEWTVYTPANSVMPVNMIHGIAIDKSDNVWLALGEYVTESYLVKISNDKWDVYGEKDFGFKPYWFGGIQCDSKNRVWVNINYVLSSTLDPSRPMLFTFDGKKANILSSCSVISFIDHNDNAWSYSWCDGKRGYGVWIDEQWKQFDNFELGVSDRSLLIKEDPFHRMWFGTEDGIYISENF